MGLTTSRESIERQVSPVETEPERAPPIGSEGVPRIASSKVAAGIRLEFENTSPLPQGNKRRADNDETSKKKKLAAASRGTPKKKKLEAREHPNKRKKSTQAKASVRSPSATPVRKRVAPKGETPPPEAANESRGGYDVIRSVSKPLETPRTPMNAHRVKILVGKEALAAIQEGTRIYIKSGEGNGGDTWWDSGIIRKIHERGKPFEVEWESHNNRGEEVDTDVERRIGLPVTYSIAGAAAEAIQKVKPGTEAAGFARKSVLAAARIGSWCIKHPEQPWGMLDPFGEDSMTV